jgi:pimeloyl-ACP methyl ester carboxylesterase
MSRPRVVLLHAFPLDCRMWAGVRGPLEESGHGVSAPDLPGPEGESTFAAWAARVLASTDGPLVPVGCSMGGYLVFELLRQAPERIAGIGLVGTRAGDESEESRRGREETIELLADDGVPALWERLGPRLFAPGADEEVVARAREIALEQGPSRLIPAVEAIRDRVDSTPLLPSVEVPALVVAGDDDQVVPPEEADRMAAALPRARLVRVAGAGHLVPLERPAEIADAVLALLEEVGE